MRLKREELANHGSSRRKGGVGEMIKGSYSLASFST